MKQGVRGLPKIVPIELSESIPGAERERSPSMALVSKASVESIVDRLGLRERCALGIIVLLWAYSWVPDLITSFTRGRAVANLGEELATVPLAFSAQRIILLLILVLGAFVLIDTVLARSRVAAGAILLVTVPWLSVYIFDLAAGHSVDTRAIAFLVIILALLFAKPHARRVYSTLSALTLVTAVMSLILGIAPGGYGLMPVDWHSGNEKALIGSTILAGPYGHSNQLGINLALGLPFIALTLSGTRRIFGIGTVALALLWSASRTSLLVSVSVLLLLMIVVLARRAVSRWVTLIAGLSGATLVVALPLVVTDPAAFTNRGMIWQQSFRFLFASPWTGTAGDAFLIVGPLTRSMGSVVNTAHNSFVTIATLGGLVGIIALLILVVVVFYRSFAVFMRDPIPLVFLATLFLLAIIEDPVRAFILAPTSVFLIPMFASIALTEKGSSENSAAGNQFVIADLPVSSDRQAKLRRQATSL